jgi:predicted NBD/HSP70 family sugar kinase
MIAAVRTTSPNTEAPAQEWAIGLDAGGTKIAGGVVDHRTGDVLFQRVIPTAIERGGAAALDDAVTLAAALQREASQRGMHPTRLGVGVPELVDHQGRITASDVIFWQHLPVQARFDAILPTTIESDVRAAALAEARYGAGRDFALFAYVTVGTGISSTIMIAGRPLTGARGNAIALASGHLTLPAATDEHAIRQVLEQYASGPGLVRRYREATGTRLTRAEDVIAASSAGDAVAREVVRSGAASLGNSIGFLVNIIDPEAVVIGGGLGLAGGLYWETMLASIREHIWAPATRSLPIIPAALGPTAGLIGAAAATIPRSDAQPRKPVVHRSRERTDGSLLDREGGDDLAPDPDTRPAGTASRGPRPPGLSGSDRSILSEL